MYNGVNAPKRNENLDIIVEDDVWIGFDTIVLAGSKIGKGSVIGARAVVTGTIPPYSVYVGNKVIKTRFPKELIEQVKDIEYGKIDHTIGDKYEQWCTTELSTNNSEKIIKSFVKNE